MTPPAEVVHWMFAVGFLFLGLCLLAETIVGREVWRRRSWRAYLWPGVAFLMGILMWPVMVFFTSSAIHMLAHGVWAQAMMVAGAAQLGLVRGKLQKPALEADGAVRVRRLRRRVPHPRAEPLALLAGGVPPPRARLDGARRRADHARPVRAASVARLQRGLRADLPRVRRAASSATGTWRRSSATSRRSRERDESEGARRRRASSRWRCPPPRSRTQTCSSGRRRTARELETSPQAVSLRFDQGVDVFANSIDVRSSTGRAVTAGPAHTIDEGRVATVPLRRLAKGAYTVRWHATSNEGHVLSGRLHVRRAGRSAAADRGLRRRGNHRRASTSSSGATSSGSRCSSAASRSGCSCSGSARLRRVERRFYWVVGIGVVACIELGIVGFLLRAQGRVPATARPARVRRPLAARAGNALRHGVHRDDARLRARRRDPVPGLARRSAGPALAGACLRARALFGALVVGPLGGRGRLELALRARGLGSPLGRLHLGRRARPARRRRLAGGAAPPPRGVPSLLEARGRARRRDGARRARTWRTFGSRRRRTSGTSTTAACCS